MKTALLLSRFTSEIAIEVASASHRINLRKQGRHMIRISILDLDLDGDLDIVSTLKPSESSHGNTIAFHENLNLAGHYP